MIRNALEWKAVAQEYRDHNGTMKEVDARRYGALFFTRIPGGFLFKSVAEGGTSLAFVPDGEDTKRIEKLHLERHAGSDEKPAIEKYERQMFGMHEAGAEAHELEEWLQQFHDEIKPNENDRVRAGHELIDELVKLNGKNGIKVQRESTAYYSPLVAIADAGPVTIQFEKEEFFVVDANGTKKRVPLVYDPVTKSYRSRHTTQERRGSHGLKVLLRTAWRVIKKLPDEQ